MWIKSGSMLKNIIVGISLIFSLDLFAQVNSDSAIIMNAFKDERIDSILNSVTPAYANHTKLKKQIIKLLYAKKYDAILNAIKCKGFKGFSNLGDDYTEIFESDTTSDSIYIKTLENLAKNLPKNKKSIQSTFTDLNFLKDKMFFEEYRFNQNKTTYLLRIVFINNQLNGILIDIRSRY